MNPYAFSVLVFAICSFLIGIQILVRRKDITGVIYFFLSLLYCTWGVGYALCISGNLNYEQSLFSVRVSNAAAAFIPIVWLHFCLIYTDQMPVRHRSYFLLYLIPLSVLAGAFSQFFLPSLQSIAGFKYYPTPAFLCNVHTSIYFAVTPIGFYYLWKSILNLKGDEKKKQIYFLIVSFLGYFGGGLSFFPVYGIGIPQYGLFLLPLYPFGKAFFMSTSGLFDGERIAQAVHKDKLMALGILTASINHEIKNPLFLIRGTVETETNLQTKTKLLNQIDRMTDIVSRLTHFAKKGVDEAVKIEPLDIKEVLADIRPLFQPQLNYQQIEFIQDIPPNLPKVLADKRYLEEILFNLILNACQALKNQKNGKICVDVKQMGAQLLIEVKDNGPGISSEQAKNIFKPFYTAKKDGMGLGLYITKQLVEKSGGKIRVFSQDSGGAQFKIYLKIQM